MSTNFIAWIERRNNMKVRWDFIISIVKLIKPDDAYEVYDASAREVVWCIRDDSKFFDLCKWANYE